MIRSRLVHRLLVVLAVAIIFASLRPEASAQTKGPAVEKDHAEKMARGLDIFKKHVRPVLVQQCLHCHGGKTTEGQLDLSDRDRLLKGGDAGPGFVSGDAKKSLLYRMIDHERKPFMPYEEKKLPEETIRHFAGWIDNGAPYDAPLLKREDASAWTKKVIAPEARQHWAFQPLKHGDVPPVKDPNWARTPLDRFILAKLEEKGLEPNGRATKRQLIRRVYFDLVGLPPTPEEVEAFVKDQTSDAYPKMLDKLLASPHYGERWARHWLDLVRFGESHGFEHDYDRPSAYHYRDFVIQALNEGMPYDRFIKWQLAGDEIAPSENLALMATGYLAAGVHGTQITKNEVEKHRYDELDDILATTGTAMLGLTLGCARCHNHKYDAIPSRDYYRMLSTFTTAVRSETDLNFDSEGYKKAKAAFDQKRAPLEEALKKFEVEQLPERFAQWQKDRFARAGQPLVIPWVIPEIASMTSAGGATLTKQDDGSLLVSGTNPPVETLTIVLNTELTNITCVRLEAMAHPSMVKSGPGRGANGNFALTDFKVTAAPKKGGKAVAVALKGPRATFEQKGLGVAGAIGADSTVSAWAIDPQFGKTHAAGFDFATPIGFEGGTVLTFKLAFRNNVGHGMGKPRLSIADSKTAVDLKAAALPEATHRLIDLPPEKRSPAQTAVLMNWYRYLDPEWVKLNNRVQEDFKNAPKPNMVKALICSEGVPALRLHTQGDDFFKETYFLKRGDPAQKDGVAASGYLQALTAPGTDETRWAKTAPKGSRLSYRRTAFADWMTDVDNGAGRLLARVIVNRLWQHHLGRGIVATPSDFGIRGERPTHPELLDYLASELIRNGWQLKPIHKLIMLSAVYQESSASDAAKVKIDRDNLLLWRRPVQRLEAEAIRDSLLSVGGVLDTRMYGPGTLDESSKRRSVYFTMKRSKLIPMLVIFDAPDGTVGVGERPSTTIAPQALHLMNNKFVRDYAHGLAKRIAADSTVSLEQAVRNGYRIALSRDAAADEVSDGLAFLNQQMKSYEGKPDARQLALADFCQVLMCLNEFVYVE